MPTYISLIRGINVGGHKIVKMDELRKVIDKIGFENVQTYVQSGNIVFTTSRQSPSGLSKKIEDVIKKKFGHDAAVITKTAEEIAAAIHDNPFLKNKAIDVEKLHVTFLSGIPEPSSVKRLETIPSGDDQFRWRENILYLYLPNGAGNSKLASAPFEKLLGVRVTTRNWRTVNSLHQMAVDRG